MYVLLPELLDSSVIYACAGGELSLPWTASVNSPGTIDHVSWLHQSTTRDEIAITANGRFTPMPGFAGRVQQTTNAGILLDNLTMSDAGNYSVNVIVRNAGDTRVWRTSVDVIVTGTGGRGGRGRGGGHRLELSVEIIPRSLFSVFAFWSLVLGHWFASLILGHWFWVTGFGSLVYCLCVITSLPFLS